MPIRTAGPAVVTALLAALALAGCGSTDKGPTMPDLTGKKLDTAYAELDKAGIDDKDKVTVEGGGLFGIVDESNWTVCTQAPAAGRPLDKTPKLAVDRTCDDSSADDDTDTSTPEPSTEPSEDSTSTLTVKNSPELSAVLRADNCDDSLARFSTDHSGDQIEFDGSIINLAPHGDADTRFDMLVGPGDDGANTATGPTFQFTDKNAFDMNLQGANIPDNLSAGQKYRFLATVGDFDPESCLFQLDPVSTTPR